MQTLGLYVLWFLFYSVVGWIYESTVCSIQEKRWVNRGFLNGRGFPSTATGRSWWSYCFTVSRPSHLSALYFVRGDGLHARIHHLLGDGETFPRALVGLQQHALSHQRAGVSAWILRLRRAVGGAVVVDSSGAGGVYRSDSAGNPLAGGRHLSAAFLDGLGGHGAHGVALDQKLGRIAAAHRGRTPEGGGQIPRLPRRIEDRLEDLGDQIDRVQEKIRDSRHNADLESYRQQMEDRILALLERLRESDLVDEFRLEQLQQLWEQKRRQLMQLSRLPDEPLRFLGRQAAETPSVLAACAAAYTVSSDAGVPAFESGRTFGSAGIGAAPADTGKIRTPLQTGEKIHRFGCERAS